MVPRLGALSLAVALCACQQAAALRGLDAVSDGRLIGYQEGRPMRKPEGWSKPRAGQGAPEHNKQVWVEHISWEPRAMLFHNFLTPYECLYLIHKAGPHMMKSQVVDSNTGSSMSSKVRTSSGAFLMRGEDEVISAIERRIAHFSHVPMEHGEPLHILRYDEGQEYQAHYDYFHDTVNTRNGGQRIATMLMYLSDVEEGGETTFPAGTIPEGWPTTGWSKCADGQLAVKPRRGDALLFWSLKPDSSLDPSALHSGCPVVKGTKWSATKWMRVGENQ